MNESANPYASPSAPPLAVATAVAVDRSRIAGKGLRVANLLIDFIAQMGLGFVVGIVIALVGGEAGVAWLERTSELLVGSVLLMAYYFVLEATTGRTLGKLVTGTRVVDARGMPPSVGQVAVRTICRFIPFELFSFFGTPCRGWHDSLAKTFVVKSR